MRRYLNSGRQWADGLDGGEAEEKMVRSRGRRRRSAAGYQLRRPPGCSQLASIASPGGFA